MTLAALLLAGPALRAETVYNNSTNDLKVRFDPQALEVGDEIVLAGNAHFLTNFSFEYWGLSQAAGVFAGNVEVRVRFYQNDGAAFNGYSSPGTMLYDSDWFGIGPTPRNVLAFHAGTDLPPEGVYVAGTNFTWSVQFQGMGAGDTAGVDIYSPIIVGQGYPDYWQRAATGWELMTNNVAPMNFAAVVEASQTAAAPPKLQITQADDKVVLSWPLWAAEYLPETSAEVTSTTWTPLAEGIFKGTDRFVLTNAPAGNISFYRLHRQ